VIGSHFHVSLSYRVSTVMLEPDLHAMSQAQFLWSHNGGSGGGSIM